MMLEKRDRRATSQLQCNFNAHGDKNLCDQLSELMKEKIILTCRTLTDAVSFYLPERKEK